MSDVSHDAWLSQPVRFVLRGSSGDVDRALQAAGFTGPFEPDVGSSDYPPEFKHAAIANDRIAKDVKDPTGQRIRREVIRGESSQSPGIEIVYVIAYTT